MLHRRRPLQPPAPALTRDLATTLRSRPRPADDRSQLTTADTGTTKDTTERPGSEAGHPATPHPPKADVTTADLHQARSSVDRGLVDRSQLGSAPRRHNQLNCLEPSVHLDLSPHQSETLAVVGVLTAEEPVQVPIGSPPKNDQRFER